MHCRTTRGMHPSLAWRVERRFLIAVCTIALVVGIIPVQAIAQVQWKMATEYPESNISGVGLVTFGKFLASNTHGHLATVNAFDNEMKISSGETLRAVQDHRVDGGDAFAGPLESSDPIFGLSSLPFVVQSLDTAKAVAAKARPLYERVLSARGLPRCKSPLLADSVANRTSDIILLSDPHIGRQNLATGVSAIIS
jgi:TRAP-type C4-dicarboxylate transport system substrate-binding protein